MKYLKTFESLYPILGGLQQISPELLKKIKTTPTIEWTPEEESDLKGFGALIFRSRRSRAEFPKLHSSEDSSKSKLKGDAAFTGMTIIKDDPSNPQFDETIENTYTAIMYSDAGKRYPNGKDFKVYWVDPVTMPKEINFKKELLASNDWEEFKRLLKTWLK